MALAPCAVAAVAAQHWRILVVGVAHGDRRSAAGVGRLLEDFQPGAICLELDRRDFARFHAPAGAEEAAPEWAEAMRWARARPAGTTCALVPVDRDQLVTRRRLSFQLAHRPLQLLRARGYWGETPKGTLAAAWREAVRRDCPALHEVVFEERDEFMAYQILIRLDAMLSEAYGPGRGGPGRRLEAAGADGEGRSRTDASADWLARRLRGLAACDAARVSAALRWALDGPACGEGGVWAEPACCSGFRRPDAPPPTQRVLVLCGPAHADGLARQLRAALGGGPAGDAGSRHFLARNAAMFPRLLVNADWPWEVLQRTAEDGGGSGLVASARAALAGDAQLDGEDGPGAGIGAGVEIRIPILGPLTSLASGLWRRCSDSNEAATVSGSGLALGTSNVQQPSGALVFASTRLCDLSRRPLPVWPVILVAYALCPAFLLVTLPAGWDFCLLRWRVPSLPAQATVTPTGV